MSKINLLPKELAPKESFIKLSATLKKIIIIGFISLIILSVALLGGFAVLSRQLNTSNEKQEDLKSKIIALESTELRLVLVKDRLEKIDFVYKKESTSDEVKSFEKLINILPEGTFLGEASLSPSGTSVNIAINNSKTLVQLLALLLGSDIYSGIRLNSLSYSQLNGYSVQMVLVN